MRSLPYIVLAFIAIGLQAGLGHLLSVGGWSVLLPWIVAGFTAAVVDSRRAPLAALLIGLGFDLVGSGALGIWAAAFGLGGLAIEKLRGPRPTTRGLRLWSYIAAGAFVATYTAEFLELFRNLVQGDSPGLFRAFFRHFFAALGSAFFTSILAFPFAFMLAGLQKKLGVKDAAY